MGKRDLFIVKPRERPKGKDRVVAIMWKTRHIIGIFLDAEQSAREKVTRNEREKGSWTKKSRRNRKEQGQEGLQRRDLRKTPAC